MFCRLRIIMHKRSILILILLSICSAIVHCKSQHHSQSHQQPVLASDPNEDPLKALNLLQQQKQFTEHFFQQNNEKLNLLGGQEIIKCFDVNFTSNVLNNIDHISKIMIDGSRHFGLRLFQILNLFEPKTSSPGLVYSPISVWSTLILTYLGSDGVTEQELSQKLKLNQLPKPLVALAYRSLKWWKDFNVLKLMQNHTDATQVCSANKLYINDHLLVKDCFRTIFGDEIEMKSFSRRPQESLSEINDWVRVQTQGHIPNLLGPESISSNTNIVMINAVYFKSFWAQQFDSSKTKKQRFYVSMNEELEADMMTMDSVSVMYGISEELRASAVEIPYSNPDYSFLIILPDITRSLDSMIRTLTWNKIQLLLQNMYDDEVKLMIPKFRSEQEFELAGPLFSLGIKKLFDPRYANLNSIFMNSNNSRVALDSVIHKSFISVDEEGTEAAAATAVIFARSGRPAFPTEFIADRPFLYIIRDVSSNQLLFIGTVRRPYASQAIVA
ncbi:tyrosine phosphatase domain-containing protein 1-like [Sarcoptes scabiei]|nr:tyrosine phosphatase domain-containing protein 1-like [Sarcoptes scabiei]